MIYSLNQNIEAMESAISYCARFSKWRQKKIVTGLAGKWKKKILELKNFILNLAQDSAINGLIVISTKMPSNLILNQKNKMAQDKFNAVWVSHSSIGDFLKCPRLYYLHNVYKNDKG